tara:strand:- start:6741 stop:7025 length:285 start_codon:yes stop_codon:yes gene_type:complete
MYLPKDVQRLILEYDCALDNVWKKEQKHIKWLIKYHINQPFVFGDHRNMQFEEQWNYITTLGEFKHWTKFMSLEKIKQFTKSVNSDAWNEYHNC